MAYEPLGKVKLLADAMAADPQRIWTSADVAKVMDVHQGSLTAHLDPAIRNGAIFRKLEHGKCQYALKPFPQEAAGAADGLRVPKFGEEWAPPKITAPRPGTDVPHVNPPKPIATTAPVVEQGAHRWCPGCEKSICRAKWCVSAAAAVHIIPAISEAPSPTPAPSQAAAPTHEHPQEDEGAGDGAEGAAGESLEEVVEEEVPFDFCMWKDGGMQVWGAEQYTDGSFKLTAQQLYAIRKATAWMPPPPSEMKP